MARFLKKLQLSRKNPTDDRISVTADALVYFESTNAMRVPTGTTVQQPTGAPGYVRYNTTNSELEAYVNGAWRNVRYKEPTSITKISLGTGDDIETTFGPFNPSYIPNSADSIIVLVENVMQISTTNFTLVQNPGSGPNAPYASGWYLVFSEAVPTGKAITVYYGFDQ